MTSATVPSWIVVHAELVRSMPKSGVVRSAPVRHASAAAKSSFITRQNGREVPLLLVLPLLPPPSPP